MTIKGSPLVLVGVFWPSGFDLQGLTFVLWILGMSSYVSWFKATKMPHKQIGQFFLAIVIDADCVQVTILKSIVASCKLRFMFLILVLWMHFEGEKKFWTNNSLLYKMMNIIQHLNCFVFSYKFQDVFLTAQVFINFN